MSADASEIGRLYFHEAPEGAACETHAMPSRGLARKILALALDAHPLGVIVCKPCVSRARHALREEDADHPDWRTWRYPVGATVKYWPIRELKDGKVRLRGEPVVTRTRSRSYRMGAYDPGVDPEQCREVVFVEGYDGGVDVRHLELTEAT